MMESRPSVHIILCTFQPDPDFFREQIASLRQQSWPHFTCDVRDDGSSSARLENIRAILAGDARFQLTENPHNLGVYHNFEAGLRAAPGSADFIAYCDQDDIWHPEKIAHSLEALRTPGVVAVHGDLEIINAAGASLHPSTFAFEKRNLEDLSAPQLIIRNAVTGCTLTFRRDLVASLLPFPPQPVGVAFHHDLWTALIASLNGEIATLHRPLVKYRQHGGNLVGAAPVAGAGGSPVSFQTRSQRWLAHWNVREGIISAVLDRAAALPLAAGREDVKTLRKWIKPSPVSFSLMRRALALKGRYPPAWQSAKSMVLGRAFKFRPRIFTALRGARSSAARVTRMLGLVARTGQRVAFDAAFRRQLMASLERASGNAAAASAQAALGQITPGSAAARSLESLVLIEKTYLAPLDFEMSAKVPSAVFIVPSARTQDIFGGLATAFRLAAMLANAGCPVRVVSAGTPLSAAEKDETYAYFKETAGLHAEAASRLSLHAINSEATPVHRNDVFFATAWWTATRLAETLQPRGFSNPKFHYLIQDYEPGFFPWADEYALAASSYRLSCTPIVNSRYLADFLAKEAGLAVSPEHIISPAIDFDSFHPPAAAKMRKGAPHKVFVYGRPSTPRNLFAIAVAGLRRFIASNGLTGETLEVISAGESHPDIDLGAGVMMRSAGKMSLRQYAHTLRDCDIGLSLMLSPHPSYPPFEMAASGLSVVTNLFSAKTMAFSSNFIVTEAGPNEIADGLRRALLRAPDTGARLAGARFDLSGQGRPIEEVAASLAASITPLLQAPAPAEAPAIPSQALSTGSRPLAYTVPLAPPGDLSGRKICLFSHFDPEDELDPHVRNYIRSLKMSGYETILISSTMALGDAALAEARELCLGIVQRENRGYDFAGWALALDLFPGLLDAGRILLANDSVYGPMSPLDMLFSQMDARGHDFWGLTESLEIQPHIQSYFLSFGPAALRARAFRDFWSRVRPLADKNEVIQKYELTLGTWLEQAGLSRGVYVASKTAGLQGGNPTLDCWRQLVSRHRFPFVKVQLLRDNPLGNDISDWRETVARTGYDTGLIEAHLRRVRPDAEALVLKSQI